MGSFFHFVSNWLFPTHEKALLLCAKSFGHLAEILHSSSLFFSFSCLDVLGRKKSTGNISGIYTSLFLVFSGIYTSLLIVLAINSRALYHDGHATGFFLKKKKKFILKVHEKCVKV